MSVEYWGIRLYGVAESNLTKKWYDNPETGESGIHGILNDLYDENYMITVSLPNGKKVPLYFEPTEDESYFGYVAGYPWDFKENKEDVLTRQDVEDAIVKFLSEHGYDAEDVRDHIEDISSYNCC